MAKIHKNRLMRLILWVVVLEMVLYPAVGTAKPRMAGKDFISRARARSAPAANALPVINTDIHTGNEIDGVSSIDTDADTATMDVQQTQANIVINWQSFDIGEDATVNFKQKDALGNIKTNWSALNRIWDKNPSAIFGQLNADGRVFLINQNGMIFGENARVNAHTLVASSLDMDEKDFLGGAWKEGNIRLEARDYYKTLYDDDPDYEALETEIINQGYIQADSSGAVFLAAPNVTNEGTVVSPTGQAALAAGSAVALLRDEKDDGTARKVSVTADPGYAVNAAGATLSAERGTAGMYGGVVNQDGLIRTVTALEIGGKIELRAGEFIRTGEQSLIQAEISPSEETYEESHEMDGSEVVIGALNMSPTVEGEESDYPLKITLEGSIEAPGAQVNINATDEVTVGSHAVIDVAGLWSDRSADENELEVQLNSVELSDAFYVREGDIKGATIYVNALEGTPLAHINGYLTGQQLTARQQTTEGGTAIIKTFAEDSRIHISDGAGIDFSGGGYHFSAGEVRKSYVRLGSRIYEIGEIPDSVLEQGGELALVGDGEVWRLGLATYQKIQAYDEGHDAGKLSLEADTISLKGDISGSVVQGIYQHHYGGTEPYETIGDVTYQTARGRSVPSAGTLILGKESPSVEADLYLDYALESVRITADDSENQGGVTYVSAETLNNAGLGQVFIHVNDTLSIDPDVTLNLSADGEFDAVAARILHQGAIYVPGGEITLKAKNTTGTASEGASPYTADNYIFLDKGSVLSAAGINKDYALLDGSEMRRYGNDLLEGGTIFIEGYGETTDRFVLCEGSVMDVSGGYVIDPTGTRATGGDAGTITVDVRAAALEGDFLGHAMVGQEGGTLQLTAVNLNLVNHTKDLPRLPEGFDVESALPEVFKNTLYLSAEQIESSGFSNIQLGSLYSPSLASDLDFSPSHTKYIVPLYQRKIAGSSIAVAPLCRQIEDAYLSPSHLSIKTNQYFEGITEKPLAGIALDSGAGLSVAPGGTITLESPLLNINGTLTALSGTVNLKTDTSIPGSGLTLGPEAFINVKGFLRPVLASFGTDRMRYEPENGGSVILESEEGPLVVAEGARVDVSGAEAVENIWFDSSGKRVMEVPAGEAGMLTMTAQTFDMDPKARFVAGTDAAQVKGGDLILSSTDRNSLLPLDLNLLQRCAENGFDAMTLQSLVGIDLQASEDNAGETIFLGLNRQLVLDTPLISNATGIQYDLYAPYVRLVNNYEKYAEQDYFPVDYLADIQDLTRPEEGTGAIHGRISGRWLDMAGLTAVDGLTSLQLAFTYDIQLEDGPVNFNSDQDIWYDYQGGLMTLADLDIQCDRIFPATDASFTIENGFLEDGQWVGGDYLNITGPDPAERATGEIYSAGGALIIRSNDMTFSDAHVFAPMGTITLAGEGGDSRVRILNDTMLSVTSDAAVAYGYYSEQEWNKLVKTDVTDNVFFEVVSAAPERGVHIRAVTIEAEADTHIDLSGGGAVYTYAFEPSISGSANPITDAARPRYVILPDNSVRRPGEGIFLTGVAGLEDGFYSVLDESYAFVPGAVILEDLGVAVPGNVPKKTAAGDPVGIGVRGYTSTEIRSTEKHLYAVRSADDVLTEGQYYGAYLEAGDGGTFTAQGTRTTLEGNVDARGLEGYGGGRTRLSAANIYVGDTPDIGGQGLTDLLRLGKDFFSDAGFEEIELGRIDMDLEAFNRAMQADFEAWPETSSANTIAETENIIIEEGMVAADHLALFATDLVKIGAKAQVTADELLVVTSGIADLTAGTHPQLNDPNIAAAKIQVDCLGVIAGQYDLTGTPEVNTMMALGSADPMALVRQGVDMDEITGTAMVLGEQVWRCFEEIPAVKLVGPAGITVYDGIDLNVTNETSSELQIHTSMLAVQSTDSGQSLYNDMESHWQADNIAVYGMQTDAARDYSTDTHTLQLEAGDTLGLYGGDVDETGDRVDRVRFDGLQTLKLAAANDMVFGVGRMETGNSDLVMKAARLTSVYEQDGDGQYRVGDYAVDAGTATITTLRGDGAAGDLRVPGGRLILTADTIQHGGVIDIWAGRVGLIAEGAGASDGLFLLDDAQILTRGGAKAYDIAGETVIDVNGGGVVHFSSGAAFEMAGSAVVDVSNRTATDLDAEMPDGVDNETLQSWAKQGLLDAGAVLIDAPNADLAFSGQPDSGNGPFKGMAGKLGDYYGQGGTFTLDAHETDVDATADLLATAGFDQEIGFRVRSGDINLEKQLTAQRIKLVADDGAINVRGTLDATGTSDDRGISLYARDQVNLFTGGLLDASGTGAAAGGEVIISSTDEWITMETGSVVDVSGIAEDGAVTFVAERYYSQNPESTPDVPDADDVKVDLKGVVHGAREVAVQALVRHEAANNSQMDAYGIETLGFMNRMTSADGSGVSNLDRMIQDLTLTNAAGEPLTGAQASERVRLVPHLELYTTGDFTLNNDWLFSGVQGTESARNVAQRNDWRYGEDRETGVLTLRAGGDLTIEAEMIDEAQDAVYLVFDPEKGDAWSYNLVAGADLGNADPMAVIKGTGDLEIVDGNQLYTESGSIRLAAGRDVILEMGNNGADTYALGDLTYSVATYDEDIEVYAGRDLVLLTGEVNSYAKPAAIQTNTGDIRVSAGRHVDLSTIGTGIRTLGKLTQDITLEQLLNTQGNNERTWRPSYEGTQWEGAWEYTYPDTGSGNTGFRNAFYSFIKNAKNKDYWLYEDGGDIRIKAGQDVLGSSSVHGGWMALYADKDDTPEDPDFVKYTASYTDPDGNGIATPFSGIGTMAGGDVFVNAGRHVNASVGIFMSGDLQVRAGGDLAGRFLINDGAAALAAMGSFGVDPGYNGNSVLELGKSSLDLKAQGDVVLGTVLNPVYAAPEFLQTMWIDYAEHSQVHIAALTGDLEISGDSHFHGQSEEYQKWLLPPRVDLVAGGDLLIKTRKLVLAPSAQGQLSIIAGGNIRADYKADDYGWIYMAAEAPEMYYTRYLRPEGYETPGNAPGSGVKGFEGFYADFLDAFNAMWTGLDTDEKEDYQAIYDRINSDLALHEKDLELVNPDDLELVPIRAGQDIYGINLVLPKAAEISAGRDIIDLHLMGQNNNGADASRDYTGDITSITAARDILFSMPPKEMKKDPELRDITDSGIILRGPGWLLVNAGRGVDIGLTQGVMTIGQGDLDLTGGKNTRLDKTGATLLMSAGYGEHVFQDEAGSCWDPERILGFYTDLRDAGLVYSALKQGRRTDPYNEVYDADLGFSVPITYDVDLDWVSGITDTYDWAEDLEVADMLGLASAYDDVPQENREILADRVVTLIQENLIGPFLTAEASTQTAQSNTGPPTDMGIGFKTSVEQGVIDMVQSQIVTKNGGGVYILAMDDLDVGLSAFDTSGGKAQSGINAQLMGDIGIIAQGDLNVNESRIMTWYGGDIMLWSNEGSINAGKGSKTAVSLASNEIFFDEELEQWLPKNSPPAVGSGIRLLTHDPDGPSGPQEEANPGNGYLFAPLGDIDAGEAGIAGIGTLVFEAQRLLNVQNIESGAVSIGLTSQGEADAGITGLQGGNELTPVSNLDDEEGLMKNSQDRFKEMVKAMGESLVPKWLAVEVTGFGDATHLEDEEEGVEEE